MIFIVSSSFISACAPPDLSDIACMVAQYGHFIKASNSDYKIFRQAVKDHGSTNQKECFRNHLEIFDIPDNLFRYLRCIDIDDSFTSKDFLHLITSQSRLITENANNEWPVYKHFIDVYKSDPTYSDVFTLLKKAKDKNHLTGIQAGGAGELLKSANQNSYEFHGKNLTHLKTCVLFDRDTDNDTYFDGNKNPLFKALAGKTHLTITDDDIYQLSHEPLTWHMWYKRAIENYFPDEQYIKAGFDPSPLNTMTQHQRDYALIGGKKSNPQLVNDYSKGALKDLLSGFSRAKIEKHLKVFNVNGENISEIQLFLLKLVKII